jgi:RNA polymerase sigma factor (sigma-70 family)
MRSLRRKLVQNMKKDQLPENVKENTDSELYIVYSFEEELIARENLSRREEIIKECLMELNPRQREILYYRYTCNLDYEEICELMSLKYDSARKLVFRAITTLKKMMGDTVNLQLFFGIFRK